MAMNKSCLQFSFFFCIFHLVLCSRHPQIAIVGGGIGGTSCAFFLKQLFREDCKITLYEQNLIGGRLRVQNVDGKLYEAGGSIIHPTNKHMVDFLSLLDLKRKIHYPNNFGIYDGEKFVFEESYYKFITLADLFWRYGFSYTKLWDDMKSTLGEFNKIYEVQDEKFAFTTVYNMLEYLNPGFKNLTQETFQAHLQKKGFPKLLLDELVQSINIVNFGQTNDMSAFSGYISLGAVDSDLWSVEGGNNLIPSGLLSKSKANVVNGQVSEIELMSSGTYTLKYTDLSSGDTQVEPYDIVILATPLIKGQKIIKFTNFKKEFDQYESAYERIVTTFVKGLLNPLAFNSPSIPDEILTFRSDLPFNNIAKVRHVSEINPESKEFVYRIFSSKPLSEKDINTLFKKVESYKEVDWLAYPHYEPPDVVPPFLLHPNLYYIDGIEMAGSCMEMSAVAAKNVALLAYNTLFNKADKIDPLKVVSKDEL